jgi:hypothetical protein
MSGLLVQWEASIERRSSRKSFVFETLACTLSINHKFPAISKATILAIWGPSLRSGLQKN